MTELPDWAVTDQDRLHADITEHRQPYARHVNLQGATYHLNHSDLAGETAGQWLSDTYPRLKIVNAAFTDTDNRNPTILYEPYVEPPPEEEDEETT